MNPKVLKEFILIKVSNLISFTIVILILFQFSCSDSENNNHINSQSILIYGDSRTDHTTHQNIVDAMLEKLPTVVFHTGDLVEDGLNSEHWNIFNEITSELIDSADFYPALGNHELNSQLYFDNFDLPNNERWYSVDIDKIHFIVLDSNSETYIGSRQYLWLERDLQNIFDYIIYTIAIFHHPPFSTGPHIEDEMNLRHTIIPLFEHYGVDIVFNGHEHAYERSLYNDIYYIVTSGGGAPLYDQARTSPYSQVFIKSYHFCHLSISNNKLYLEVLDIDSDIIDEFIVD